MKPNAKVYISVNEVSMHVHNANFDVLPFPHSDAGTFSIVRGWGHDSIFNIVLYTLEDAASLMQAVSEVVEFFAELEAAKIDGQEKAPTEGGEHE